MSRTESCGFFSSTSPHGVASSSGDGRFRLWGLVRCLFCAVWFVSTLWMWCGIVVCVSVCAVWVVVVRLFTVLGELLVGLRVPCVVGLFVFGPLSLAPVVVLGGVVCWAKGVVLSAGPTWRGPVQAPSLVSSNLIVLLLSWG